jgi:hypothetical protein
VEAALPGLHPPPPLPCAPSPGESVGGRLLPGCPAAACEHQGRSHKGYASARSHPGQSWRLCRHLCMNPLTSGDTWQHGAGTDVVKLADYMLLTRARAACMEDTACDSRVRRVLEVHCELHPVSRRGAPAGVRTHGRDGEC